MSTNPSAPENDPNLSGIGRALLGSNEGSKPSGPWVPPTAEELHAILPQYEIVKMLGRGGMGAVYMGTQTALERPVAIKILSSALEDSDAGFTERFKNEAKAMAKLNHPGIVSVYDFGEAPGGLLYIVMEYVDGTDVAKMIAAKGRLHTEHAMAITAHVCDALAYAHERGIIHRDIKPANIMVGYDGEVKVADFGLAKVNVGGKTLGLTMSGMAMGTLHFMAPEALMLGTSVDHRADIYAVGVMLYQMLTGKLPQGMFKMPSLLVPGLDPRYDGIVAKAIIEDREARYQGAREMRADLDSILTQPVMKMETPGTVSSSPSAVSAVTAHPQLPTGKPPLAPRSRAVPQTPLPKPRRGLAWVWVSLIILVGSGTWLLWPKKTPLAVAPKVENETPVKTTLMRAEEPQLASKVETPANPTPAVTTVEWTIPFTRETYSSAKPDIGSDPFYWIEADNFRGMLTWHFADPRLSKAGVQVQQVRLRFKTSAHGTAASKDAATVHYDGQLIGTQRGIAGNSWIDIPLATGSDFITRPAFDLSLRCGKDGIAVMHEASGQKAHLVVTVSGPVDVIRVASLVPEPKPDVPKSPPSGTMRVADLLGLWQCTTTTGWSGTYEFRSDGTMLTQPDGTVFHWKITGTHVTWDHKPQNPVHTITADKRLQGTTHRGNFLTGIRVRPDSTAPISTLPENFGGHRYQFISGFTTWQAAHAKSQELGGHLATVESPAEHAWIVSTYVAGLAAGEMIFIGGGQSRANTPWSWVMGETIGHTYWTRGEPNNATAKGPMSTPPFYLAYHKTPTEVGWNDLSESDPRWKSQLRGFLVEWDMESKVPVVAATTASATLWIDSKGRSLQAGFVRLDGERVHLSISGKQTPVSMDSLSLASQQIARQLAATAPKPLPTPAPAPTATARPFLSSTQVSLDISIENNATDLVTINLERDDRTLMRTKPGKNIIIECRGIRDGKHHLYFWTDGCAGQWISLEVKDGKPAIKTSQVTLYRMRYVIVKSVFNTRGSRELNGAGMKELRQAYVHWTGPRWTSGTDWQFWQSGVDGFRSQNFGDTLWLNFHRYNSGFGFLRTNEAYDAMTTAPDTGYKCEDIKAVKGLTLYFRQDGNGGDNQGYGKLIIEGITDTPPKGVEVLTSRP